MFAPFYLTTTTITFYLQLITNSATAFTILTKPTGIRNLFPDRNMQNDVRLCEKVAFHGRRCRSSSLSANILVEEAEEGFVDSEENLEEGEVLLKAIKAFAMPVDDYERGEFDSNKMFLCAGALVQRPKKDSFEQETDDDDIICDAWIADSIEEGVGPNLQVRGALRIVDVLFHHHLMLERDRLLDCDKGKKSFMHMVIRTARDGANNPYTCASHRAALARGFRPAEEEEVRVDNYDGDDYIDDCLFFDYVIGVQRYTAVAWDERGTETGEIALKILALLGCRRAPFHFANERKFDGPITGRLSENVRGSLLREQSVLPAKVANDVLSLVDDLSKSELPFAKTDSFEYSLIESGEKNASPLASQIFDLVEPYVQKKLLKSVETMFNCSTVVIDNIFIQRHVKSNHYEDNIESSIQFSHGDTPFQHDALSVATAVIMLDDSAANPGGPDDGGFYVCISSNLDEMRSGESAAIRRFIPLWTGDAVIYSWDVMHGMNVPPLHSVGNLDGNEEQSKGSNNARVVHLDDEIQTRSLVVTFKERIENSPDCTFPWLECQCKSEEEEEDGIVLFAKGRAIEAKLSKSAHEGLIINGVFINERSKLEAFAHDCYVRSARSGNTNALTRLGTLAQSGSLSSDMIISAVSIFDNLPRLSSTCISNFTDKDFIEKVPDREIFAQRLWFAAAIRGNAHAQVALADACVRATRNEENCTNRDQNDVWLQAAVLAALAVRQGNGRAAQLLQDLLDGHAEQTKDSQQNPAVSEIIKVATAAII